MKKIIMIFVMLAAVAAALAREPKRGYRGFIEWDNSFGKGDWFSCADGEEKHEDLLFIGLSTSHGYQINNHAYVGAGFMLSLGYPCMMLPIFADFRYDISFGKFTPYADARLGYSLSDGGSVYFSPTVGYRFNWGRKANFNIGIGLTLCGQTDKYSEYVSGYGYKDKEIIVKDHKVFPRFSLRLGFDF